MAKGASSVELSMAVAGLSRRFDRAPVQGEGEEFLTDAHKEASERHEAAASIVRVIDAALQYVKDVAVEADLRRARAHAASLEGVWRKEKDSLSSAALPQASEIFVEETAMIQAQEKVHRSGLGAALQRLSAAHATDPMSNAARATVAAAIASAMEGGRRELPISSTATKDVYAAVSAALQ